MTLSASNPFLASTRWRAIIRATSGDYLGQYGTRLRSLWNVIRCKNKTSREFLRKPGQNVFGNAYNTATNASENFLVFAGTPASLTAFALAFAGTPASLAAFALAFAGVPQIEKRTFWHLQNFRGAFPKTFWPSRDFHRNSLLALFFRRTHRKKRGAPLSWRRPL